MCDLGARQAQKNFQLNYSIIILNSWINCVLLSKFFPPPVSGRVLPFFSVTHLGIWSSLELNFMEGDRFRSIFILIYVDIQFSKNWLLKMLIFLQFMFWHHSQISDGCSYKHLHLDFLFYFIVLHFYFVSIYLCFYCYTSVIYWYME